MQRDDRTEEEAASMGLTVAEANELRAIENRELGNPLAPPAD